MDNIQNHIIRLIQKTFDVVDKVYNYNDESLEKTNAKEAGSRIIFPRYSEKRGGTRRISEQELRFIFIEQFNSYCNEHPELNLFYSVETPTEFKFDFSNKDNPHVIKDGEGGGQSAMFDTTIHDDKGKRLCSIEFKANNPERFCYHKDFVKLEREPGLGFFVQIIEKENSRTMRNIIDKTKSQIGNSIFVCHRIIEPQTYYQADKEIDVENWKRL